MVGHTLLDHAAWHWSRTRAWQRWTHAAQCCPTAQPYRAAQHARFFQAGAVVFWCHDFAWECLDTLQRATGKGACLSEVPASIQDSCAGGMGGEAEDVKVKPEAASNVINIVVKDQNSGEVHFKVKPTTKFSKIFDAYAGKKGVEAANIKFLHDGQRIRDHQTPGELGIEDNDVIDCLLEQVGGALR